MATVNKYKVKIDTALSNVLLLSGDVIYIEQQKSKSSKIFNDERVLLAAGISNSQIEKLKEEYIEQF